MQLRGLSGKRIGSLVQLSKCMHTCHRSTDSESLERQSQGDSGGTEIDKLCCSDLDGMTQSEAFEFSTSFCLSSPNSTLGRQKFESMRRTNQATNKKGLDEPLEGVRKPALDEQGESAMVQLPSMSGRF